MMESVTDAPVRRTPEAAPEAAPASVRWAVRIMYAGAAAGIAGIFVNVITLGAIQQQRPIMSAALRTSTQHQAIAEFIVGGIVVAGVWTFMALSCRAGKPWARLVSTVLFAIYAVYTAEIVVEFDEVRPPDAVRVYTGIVWLIGLTAVILLWQRTTTPHFRARPRLRTAAQLWPR
ncbi:MAG TPA: hypothetical protein VF060_24435 [Trebonia sp.]